MNRVNGFTTGWVVSRCIAGRCPASGHLRGGRA
jgi:hypothetical protein